MAAGFLSKPGTEYGPCDPICGHTDCAQTRQMANTPCRICGEPIGYERRFFDSKRDGIVHEVCLVTELAAKPSFVDGFIEVTQ